MKFWKHSLIAICSFLSIATVVTYSSCTTDSCKALKCRNGGTCADEFCRCPDGWEGTQCELFTRNKYVGKYHGITKINNEPVIQDSAYMVDETGTQLGVLFNLYSRKPHIKDALSGVVNKEGQFTVNNPDQTITVTLIGNDRIEILFEEKLEGQKHITHFQGTKE